MARRACLDCGRPASGTRCRKCATADSALDPHGTPRYSRLRKALVTEALETGVGCAVCGTLERLTMDLRVPWRQWRGSDPLELRNLRVVCAFHNTGKGDRAV